MDYLYQRDYLNPARIRKHSYLFVGQQKIFSCGTDGRKSSSFKFPTYSEYEQLILEYFRDRGLSLKYKNGVSAQLVDPGNLFNHLFDWMTTEYQYRSFGNRNDEYYTAQIRVGRDKIKKEIGIATCKFIKIQSLKVPKCRPKEITKFINNKKDRYSWGKVGLLMTPDNSEFVLKNRYPTFQEVEMFILRKIEDWKILGFRNW